MVDKNKKTKSHEKCWGPQPRFRPVRARSCLSDHRPHRRFRCRSGGDSNDSKIDLVVAREGSRGGGVAPPICRRRPEATTPEQQQSDAVKTHTTGGGPPEPARPLASSTSGGRKGGQNLCKGVEEEEEEDDDDGDKEEEEKEEEPHRVQMTFEPLPRPGASVHRRRQGPWNGEQVTAAFIPTSHG